MLACVFHHSYYTCYLSLLVKILCLLQLYVIFLLGSASVISVFTSECVVYLKKCFKLHNVLSFSMLLRIFITLALSFLWNVSCSVEIYIVFRKAYSFHQHCYTGLDWSSKLCLKINFSCFLVLVIIVNSTPFIVHQNFNVCLKYMSIF